MVTERSFFCKGTQYNEELGEGGGLFWLDLLETLLYIL